MSETRYKIVELGKIFDFSISTNSGLTKSFVNLHKGEVPVYGASKDESKPSYGYIQDNLESVRYFNDCLTYNKDGATGRVFFRKGHFTISEKVVPLIVFDKYRNIVDFNYLKYAIESESKKQSYTFSNKATKFVFRNLKIKIPVDETGKFDIEKQKELAERYQIVEEQRKVLLDRVKALNKMEIILSSDDNIKWAYPKVTELFYPQGGNSEYTQKWVSENVGEFSLYSGATTGDYAKVNKADYVGEFLTWVKDGLAGYIMYHNEAFCITCHRGVLIPTDKCINVNLKYIKYVLEPIFRNRKKGREGNLGKNEYTSLSPSDIKSMKDTIPIPVRDDGSYDFEKQKELADKYEQIEEIKQYLVDKITELTEIVVV